MWPRSRNIFFLLTPYLHDTTLKRKKKTGCQFPNSVAGWFHICFLALFRSFQICPFSIIDFNLS